MNFNRPLILASSSPRRQYLMHEAGFQFQVRVPDLDESFPAELAVTEVPGYLAEKKARLFESIIKDEIIISSDTVVILNKEILNKPLHKQEAIAMLTRLSGKTHTVITSVCLLASEKLDCFDDHTEVTFKKLAPEEINFYVDNFKPYDKAGSYGAQDCLPAGVNPCSKEEIAFLKQIDRLELIEKTFTTTQTGIGLDAIEKIKGSYFNVMGLPIHRVYTHLKMF